MSENIDLILAENSYFVVAVAAMNTIQNLILAEPIWLGPRWQSSVYAIAS
ncbi:hypothetical protein [Arthrobacter sp. MMS18-M83]|nr:hypothetical protein [Arthrobacter sp. MMS18-M83]WAH96187.1 hypothetical protein OW521_17420 [Arthrobacter sp. MMS18-M83]